MKKKIILLIVALGLVVGAYAGYKYLYKDHRNIETEKAALQTTSSELQQLFTTGNGQDALNKTIEVKGTVTQVEENAITLDDKVQCSFSEAVPNITVGKVVVVKGRCIGYDDLFEIVKLDQSTLTQP